MQIKTYQSHLEGTQRKYLDVMFESICKTSRVLRLKNIMSRKNRLVFFQDIFVLNILMIF